MPGRTTERIVSDDDLSRWLTPETVALREVLGGLKPETDERLVQPLIDQVRKVLAWGASEQPERFRRSIPVHRDDHDILVCDVIAKLVGQIVELELILAGLFDAAGITADQFRQRYASYLEADPEAGEG